MSRTIITQSGDTFDSLARRVYGDHTQAALLRRANPDRIEPFSEGLVIDTPAAFVFGGVPADGQKVVVQVDGFSLDRWTDITIARSIGSMSTMQVLSANRDLLRPLSYSACRVVIDGTPIFVGTLVNAEPTLEATATTLRASFYSHPAVLASCCPSPGMDAFEWRDANLQEIMIDLCAPLGVQVQIDCCVGSPFENVSIDPDQKILPWLIGLAQQRGVILGATDDGKLLAAKEVAAGSPVAHIEEGTVGVSSIIPVINGQEIYSSITAFAPAGIGREGGRTTVRNPHVAGIIRPFSFVARDTLPADLEVAAMAKMGRMFANAIQYKITLGTWEDAHGQLWRPNTTVTVNSASSRINNKELLIRSVALSMSGDAGRHAVLTVILPGTLSGQLPEVLPWD